MTQNVVAVIGMPRSGTSVITRSLRVLGIPLSDTLVKPSQSWNPTGFWEDTEIVNTINREVLYALNHNWMSVRLVEYDESLSQIKILKEKAIQLLQKKIGKAPYWAFKDPRTTTILPFWQSVFRELNLKDHYVIALRHPILSAYSNQKLSQLDFVQSMLIWLMHLIPAILETSGRSRLVVSYASILADPRSELARMGRYFGLSLNEEELSAFTNQFLDKKLAHFNDNDLSRYDAVTNNPPCLNLYQLLLKLAQDDMVFESDDFAREWQTIMQTFHSHYSSFLYIDELLEKNKSLQKSLRSIKRSIPWKLIYPLRLIDGALRAYRHKKREKKRLRRATCLIIPTC